MLAALFDRLGRYESAATIVGCALNPPTAGFPEVTTAIAHLRDVLGDPTYESLARKGEAMTTSTMATHAYDQIDQARAELNAVSKYTQICDNGVIGGSPEVRQVIVSRISLSEICRDADAHPARRVTTGLNPFYLRILRSVSVADSR